MKKTFYLLLTASLFCCTAGARADSNAPAPAAELRPMQKAMQARAGWMKDMNANLAAAKYEDVARDATALATQTDSAGKSAANPLAKDLTLKISSLALAAADAAAQKDEATVKEKLAGIKATCAECHAKIRDKL